MPSETPHIILRRTVIADLDHFFRFQLDEAASYLAAFTPNDRADRAAYLARHTKFLSDPTINNQTIICNNIIVGSIAKFLLEGNAELTYWIERNYWGKGIATKALRIFLANERTRPIYARVAFDNFGSQRVLEKCGFTKTGTDSGFANARQLEIEEFIYKLSN